MKSVIKNKGKIVALFISAMILLLLIGIVIFLFSGNRLILDKKGQIKRTEIEDELRTSIENLQSNEQEVASLDDITQEWIDEQFPGYECIIEDNAAMNGKLIKVKDNESILRFWIDQNLVITKLDDESSLDFSYETIKKDDQDVQILVKIKDEENGVAKIRLPNNKELTIKDDKKKEHAIDYVAQIGEEYKFKITSENGEEKERTILIDSYYHKITKKIGEGVVIDNIITKAEDDKQYRAVLSVEDGYLFDTIKVTMGEKQISVSKEDGIINIDNVIDDIKIEVSTFILGIKITNGVVNYWPLQSTLNAVIENDSDIKFTMYNSNTTPDFSNGAYLMNDKNYITATKSKVISSPKTMVCQFKLNTVKGVIFGQSAYNSTDCYGIHYNSNGFITYNGRWGYGDAITYSNRTGNWINAVFTHDSTTRTTRLYFNGEQVSVGTGAADVNMKLTIGSNADGLIKNFAIYNRVLTADEAKDVFR